jgi:hypothetical protein
MAQNFTEDVFASGHVGQTDLQNMENNFQCLKSMFFGASAPSNIVAGMPWFDATKKLQKIRNQANDEWFGIFQGDASQKMLIYRNDIMDGYVLETLLSTDRIIGLKSTGGTYATAGTNNLGSWTLPNYTLLTADVPAHTHGAGGSHAHDLRVGTGSDGSGPFVSVLSVYNSSSNASGHVQSGGSHTHTSVGGGGAHNHGATFRPAAAVVTIQYLDI